MMATSAGARPNAPEGARRASWSRRGRSTRHDRRPWDCVNPSRMAQDPYIKRPRYFTTFPGVYKAAN